MEPLSDAAKSAVEGTRKDLDSHGNEVLVVAQAASRAAEDIEQVKNDLAALRADAEKLGMAINSVTSTVVAGPGAAGAPEMEIELKREQLQSRLDAILVAAAAADAELTQAIKMASGKQPIPAQPSGQGNEGGGDTGQAGQPVNKQSGTAPRSSTEFLNQWQDALTQPGPAGSSDPRTTQAPPALDPKSPAGRAAADQMRRMLEAQGVPAGQIDARIADIFQRSQQPLPASPKPEPPTKQPAPGIGEQLGNAFNDFTNDVNEGFYDRADQTLNTVENLTGTGGEGHPGVVESWKQMMIDNAKQALVDPVGVAGPGNPLSAFSAAAHDIPEAINNPGHYMGEKLFDGTAMAATIPLGGEGALGRSLMPEMSALEHGALPGVGALTHEAVPGIPHNVIDLPPTGEHPLSSSLGGNHELPPAPMDTRGHHPAAGDQPIAHPAPDGLDHQLPIGPAPPESVANIHNWLPEINHDPNGFDPARTVNCGSCALAVDQRLSGMVPDATAGLGTLSTPQMEAATGLVQVPATPAQIEQYLVNQGPGAHTIVGVDRANGFAGHWFNAYYDGRNVYAIDGQTGEVLGWPPDMDLPQAPVTNWDMGVRR